MKTTLSKPKLPWQHNGATYCTGVNGERVCTGSQMGRRDNMHPGDDTIGKLRLQCVPFVDGCYDTGGAYWGGPANLWCAWGESEEEQVHVFVRADSRDAAKQKILSRFSDAKFHR